LRPCSTGESYSPASLWPYPKGGKCFPLAHSDSALLHAPPLLFRRGPPQPNYRKYSVRTSVTNVGLQLIRLQAWRRGGHPVPFPPPEERGRGGRDTPPTGRGTPTGVSATPFPVLLEGDETPPSVAAVSGSPVPAYWLTLNPLSWRVCLRPGG